jgi:hypothetical protein
LGGKVLQVLFGVATVADIEQLHQSIDELHQERNNMAFREDACDADETSDFT